MDDKKIQSILQDALEQEIPSSEIKLWPAVMASLVAGKKISIQQGEKMNSVNSRRISRGTLVTLVVAALMAIALVTPQGRAFAQTLLQFFRRAESNVLPLPVGQIAAPEDDQAIATVQPPAPRVSVTEAEQAAGFDARELPALPEGFAFAGALGRQGSISIQYEVVGGGGVLVLTESTNGFIQSEWDQAPVESISQVRIGEMNAEIVQGTYVVYPGETVARWNSDAPILRLRWIQDGIWFEMAKFGGVERIQYLGQDELIELAASLTNAPFTLPVTEAESLAGFDVLEPTRVPEVLSLWGAAFESKEWTRKQNTVRIFYSFSSDQYGPGLESNGVVLTQQPVESIENCDICDFVGADANVEQVKIGAATGEYVVGVWKADGAGNWVWEYEPYLQTLRWQANGMAFELLYMGIPEAVTKADMIAMAESMK
jgi:hypothetical protein